MDMSDLADGQNELGVVAAAGVNDMAANVRVDGLFDREQRRLGQSEAVTGDAKDDRLALVDDESDRPDADLNGRDLALRQRLRAVLPASEPTMMRPRT